MPEGVRSPTEPVSPPGTSRSYREDSYWLRYQEFFPGGLRVTPDNAPAEQWWSWRGAAVHLDRTGRPEAPAKLLLLHGPGAYGRMLAPYGRLPALAGLECVAPDLPGQGVTVPARGPLTYDTWVECVLDLLTTERRADGRPTVLLGVGTGGRLAYDVAACAPDDVAGVLVTGLQDLRRSDVRRCLAATPDLGGLAGLLGLTPAPLRPARVPVRWLANVAAMSNHARFAAAVCSDRLGAGGALPLEFVRSYLYSAPVLEPEDFGGPPILLAQPAEDRWTPPAFSRRFFERVAAPRRFALLGESGHLPVEETGLAELDRAARDFLDELDIR